MHVADFIAGSAGGALGVVVGYPLDTVKVRIQTQREFTGVWNCVYRTCRSEGVRGFYKGMSMPVTTVSISSSVVFGTYRNCLQGLQSLRGGHLETQPSKLDIFLSGLVAGVAQTKVKYRGPVHCILTVAREEGVLGLYKGAQALAFRDGVSFATYFLTYRIICERLTPVGQKQPDWPVVMLAGGMSGVCAWSMGTPMDVIKARLQVDGVRSRHYRGFIHCISESVRQEGLTVLFRGLGLNCLRAFPVNMAVFVAYEMVVRFFQRSK